MHPFLRWFAIGLCLLLAAGGVIAQEDDDVTEALQAALATAAGDETIAAVLQVVTPDETWVVTQGQESAGGAAVTGESRFRIASTSKLFVAVLMLQLAEEGYFDLDDPISTWLPQDVLDHLANTDSTTIRQLLLMRSGIPEYLNDAFYADAIVDTTYQWTAAEALVYAYGEEAYFAPDEGYLYTNTNYILLEMIAEAATGQPLHALLRERILDPLALANTYTDMHESLPGGFVSSLVDFDGDGTLEDMRDISDGSGLGDGALVSTAGDLIRFYQALFEDGSLIEDASYDEMVALQETGDGDLYGLGIGNYETEYGEGYGHSGAVDGYLTIVVYMPDLDAYIAATFASDNAELDVVVADALAILAEDEE